MATSFINSANAASSSGSTLACNKPTNTAQGDLMIAFVGFFDWETVTPPSSWNLVIRNVPRPGYDDSFMVYYKIAGASEAASYTWTFNITNSDKKRIHIATYRGEFDTSDPILGSNTPHPYGKGSSDFISAMSGLNVIGIAGCSDTGGNSYTVGAGWTNNGSSGDSSSDFYVNFSQFVTSENTVYGTSGYWNSSSDGESFIAVILKPSTLDSKQIVETSFASVNNSYQIAQNTITFERPYLKNNDLILCFFSRDSNTPVPTVTPPSGFTLLADHYSSTPYTKVYYKLANNEPTQYTFNFSVNTPFLINLLVYRGGINLSSPIETYSNTEYKVSNNIVRASSLTIQSPNTTLLNFISSYSYSITPATSPSSWIKLFAKGSEYRANTIQKLKWTGSGATGDIDSTLSSATTDKHAIAFAIAPDVVAPTVTTQAVSSVGTTSATGNGNITATGGVNPHSRGIAYMPASSGDISFIPIVNPSFEDATVGWGGAGTIARSTEQVKYGSYSMKVSWASGGEAYAEVHPSTPSQYSNKKMTFGAWVWCNVPNVARVFMHDYQDGTYTEHGSSFHTGDGTWQFLTITATLRSAITDLIIRCRLASSSAVSAYFDGAIVAYSDSSSPTLAFDSGNYSAGAFTKALTDLTPNTAYRAVAFAQNSIGVGNGSTVGFTTLASGPSNLKTYNTNLKANIKSINTNLIANIKSLNTNV